uniref:Structural maintenance of chromosomes protein 6-like n=1 Tax=Sinocyclocheilus grahami TaxID=75366 RepID=A0A672LYN5_SINGR
MSKRKSSHSGLTPDKRSRLSQPEPSEEDEADNFSSGDGMNTSQSVTGEVGIIESISLKNFMCHSLLGPFEFGPNVNFVVGNNGSGKSAVLTALIVALGGKAHTTNRGSSLKVFVKEGESSADVSITLRNRGRDAYKPEVFGQSINIDLRISSEGIRTYKLKSKTGMLGPFYRIGSKSDYIMKTKSMTQNGVEKHRETLQELKRKYHEKEERYKNLASLNEMQQKLDELKSQMAWSLVAEVEQEMKPMRERIAAEEKSTVKYDQKVEEWEGKIQEANGIFRKLQDQLEGVTDRMQQLQPQCAELKSRVQTRNRDLKAAEAGLHRKKTNLRDLEKDKDQLNKRIQELKHSISQANSADTHAREEKMNHIQAGLEDLSFQDSTLAQQINQFTQACATAKEKLGRMRLVQLFVKVRVKKIHLLKKKFKKGFCIRLRDPEAVDHPEYPTVLQALDIENSVVANCLIDMRGIETILLIKNAKDARKVMQSVNRPRNCMEAFTREGDQVYYNRYYSSEQDRVRYLSKDVEEEIRFENIKSIFEMGFISVHGKKINQFQVTEDERRNQTLLRRAYEDHKKEHCRKLQAELTELQNVEEPQSEDLKPLEQLSSSDQELARSKHHKKHYEEKQKAHVDMIETLKTNLNVKDLELQASIAKASEICPERLDVRRTAKSLDSEISRLRHKINTQQDQQGHRDTIVRQYHEAKENFNNIARQVKGLEAFIRQLTEIMNTRHNVYAEMRMYLSVRCMYYFDSMLSQRGYIGKMTFDHKNETLSISVQPGEGGKAVLSDMRSLSGGERSFSTVCFVLSLWAITEAPFRALDEFDVYMDMVNRRISMDMMLKVAASQRYKQFIFLTPQSMR